MKAVLIRTGSVPVHLHSFVPGSPRLSLSASSPRISLHCRRDSPPGTRGMRRASSEPDVIRSPRLSGAGSRSFQARIPEEEEYASGGSIGSLVLDDKGTDRRNYAGDWQESRIPVEELGFPGGGIGEGRNPGGGGNPTGGNADWSKMDAYYKQMLESDPANSLLLRNYGRFLHEVEGDVVKAEEYYGRAILASPGDGEVLALYGKLIWETQRDEDRAKSYFDQAVHSSPHDCMVMGLYAEFMWEAEEEEDSDDKEGGCVGGWEGENERSAAAVVEAF